jgi:transposase
VMPRPPSALDERKYLDRILDLWAEGYTAPAISEELGLHPKAVDNLVQEARRAGIDERANANKHHEARWRRNSLLQRIASGQAPAGIPGVPLRCAEFGIERAERTILRRHGYQSEGGSNPTYITVSVPRLKFLESGAA